MPKQNKDLRKMHPLRALGNIPADRGDIRTEKLEDRLRPKVAFPHKHDFYQLVVVTGGRGHHEVDFVKYRIAPPQVFVLKPGQVHEWVLDPRTRGFLIEFTRESLTASALVHSAHFIQKIHALPDEMKLKKGLFAKWRPIFALMTQETAHPGENSELYRQSYLSLFLIDLFRQEGTAKTPPAPHSEVAVRFVDLVEIHFRTEHRLEFYAAALKLSAKSLAEKVRQSLGFSPKEILRNRGGLEAKRLLVYSETPVAEIGYQLGFEDPNYFSRFFKALTGRSPQEFRDESHGGI
jgi:AraC family transcriptional activator of pobA